MASVKVSERIEAPARAVWDLLRDFGGVQRFSAGIEECRVDGEGVGSVRTLKLPGGVSIEERLEAFDDAGRRLQYAIVRSPLPLSDYLATIHVREDGDACAVEWSSTFQAEGDEEPVRKLVEGIYRSGIAGLRKAVGT